MSSAFMFRQFQLEQGQSAFKLGTDSVVLGSWLPYNSYKRILDIGGGSGILSLMMAQRFKHAQVVSVETDQPSSTDSANNFAQSKWNLRLTQVNMDALEWSKANTNEQFDLIISNPPYFNKSLKNPDSRKAHARHAGSLNAETMADLIHTHLLPTGYTGFILPSVEFDLVAALFENRGIYLNQTCYIRSFRDTGIIRKTGLFSFTKTELIHEDQFLYNENKSRSDWYAGLTADFYIK
jgi:tRNA1Val (adenine37-N6)-methyltransferase